MHLWGIRLPLPSCAVRTVSPCEIQLYQRLVDEETWLCLV